MKHKTNCKREKSILNLKYYAAMFALVTGLITIGAQTVRAASLLDTLSELFGSFAATESNAANSVICIVNPVVQFSDIDGKMLRDAIRDACPDSTITFHERVEDALLLESGQITIDKNLTIQGPGADKLAIRSIAGQGPDNRIFLINAGVTATISGLTISGVNSRGSQTDYRGIENSGDLTITDSSFKDHLAGGGIKNLGTMTVTGSIFSNNSTEFSGGGIDNSGTLTVTNSIFSHNAASGGGGILISGAI